MSDVQEEKCRREATAIAAGGGSALATRCDMTIASDVDALVSKATSSFGRVDILINNAAVAIGECITEMSEPSWQQVIDTNLTSVFRACRAAIPHMLRQGGGAIVNISSVQ